MRRRPKTNAVVQSLQRLCRPQMALLLMDGSAPGAYQHHHPTAPLQDIPALPSDHGPLMFPLDLSVATVLGQTDAEWDAVINGMPLTGTSPENTWVPPATRAQQSAPGPMAAGELSGAQKGLPESGLLTSGAGALWKTNTAGQSPSNTGAGLARPPTMQGDPATISRAVRKLSDLSVELHDFTLTIPPVEACWEPSQSTGDRPLEGKEFALDRILELSQLFIETLNQLFLPSSPATMSGHSDADAMAPDSAQLTGTKTRSLDQLCELLALSSYTRIVETYPAILEHVAACASRKQAIYESRLHPSHADGFPRLPSLAVGTFTMESSSATQVLVLVHMMEVLMTRSRYLVQCMVRTYAPFSFSGRIDGNAGGWSAAEQTRQPTVGQAALKGFRPREEATLQLLGTVRRALLELGHVQ
ncbi:hypothetical protein TOPH_00971 [Tolypocladium ophioglossoides CBS 100239]|uniref:Uncharacterized protein n=1 Tax=Tolypocladium ophioglossoides (strain CBS 100239) TaxID=1163406 RepID=A0A0L0NJV9_TOLOC|nr:hypothetical protein TOPH_00971 [Tolypocladium ophioglossoides CBS 100239]